MHSLVAFAESHDPGGVYSEVSAVVDREIRTDANRLIVPNLKNIIGAFAAVGTTGVRARLQSASLRRVNPLYITPTTELLVPPAVHPPWLFPQTPVPLQETEQLYAEEDSNPAAAEQHTVGVLLSDGPVSPVSGDIRTVRATVTGAITAGTWQFSELTLIDELPAGRYAIVGARCVMADGVLFRFVLRGDQKHTPGGLVNQDHDDLEHPLQRRGGLGVWGTFDTTVLPGFEFLGDAAVGSATYDVLMDVIPA